MNASDPHLGRARRAVRLARRAAAVAFGGVLGLSAAPAWAQSGAVSDISISAISSPVAVNELYPGGAGDVTATVDNPNSFEVAVTALELPSATTYAGGFNSSSLQAAQPGCGSTVSRVSWSFAGSQPGTSHLLTAPLAVAAHTTVLVTFTDGAVMGQTAPAACEGTYFEMPPLLGVTATSSDLPVSSGPITDSWTVANGPHSTVSPPPPATTTTTTSPAATTTTTTAVPAATHPTPPPPPNPGKAPAWHPPPTFPSLSIPPAPVPHPVVAVPKGSPGLFQQAFSTLKHLVRPVGTVSLFTFAFVPFILLFLVIQRRIDRDDPKLALAPVYSNPAVYAERWTGV